jgi:hypothetical protein
MSEGNNKKQNWLTAIISAVVAALTSLLSNL